MAKPAKETMKLLMQGDGKMEWVFPKDGNLSRAEAYEILGMLRYAENVLLKMLEQPAEKKWDTSD